MRPEEIENLVRKFIDGTSTAEEKEILNRWFRTEQLNIKEWDAETLNEEDDLKTEMFSFINQRIDHQPKSRFLVMRPRIAAAACLISVIAVSAYFLSDHQEEKQDYAQTAAKHDALPGTNGAILTLANGQKVILGKNATNPGTIRQINGVKKYSDSLLVYAHAAAGKSEETAYNTLTTPKGRQYTVVLPDGTKVWMNAASELKYPTVFSGKERLVTLTGEAYFEVNHNAKVPFKIVANNQVVEDIGTAFNINTYNDEASTRVTLIEGSVSVSKNTHKEILKPGQEALVSSRDDKITVRTADMESALAWKNGLFHFNHAKLEVVLKEISRWYDLDIEYEGTIPEKTIDGEIYRDVKASQLFTILNQLDVRFRIDGNKLIVINKSN